MASSTLVLHPTQTPSLSQSPPTSCPSCGHAISPLPSSAPEDTHRRMRDLEAQVKLLNSKAAAAVDKLADYEDEVRFLRAAHLRSQQQNGGPPQDAAQTTRLSSLSSLLMRRRNPSADTTASGTQPNTPTTATFSAQNQQPPLPPLPPGSTPGQLQNNSTPAIRTISSPSLSASSPPAPQALTLNSLYAALETERQLRQRAETSLTQTQTDLIQTQSELEELTAQLFGQANEMVATERRERAKLEERVKVLELREREKKGRLERLEERIKRVERVRVMVG